MTEFSGPDGDVEISGPNIKRGIDLKALSDQEMEVVPTVKRANGCRRDVIGTVKETVIVEIKIMVPTARGRSKGN